MAENYAFRMKDESISHHGIEGQKWGVRNGPPYPLGSGQHSKAELRAMKKEQKKEQKDTFKEVQRRSNQFQPVSKGPIVNKKLEEMRNNIPEINEYVEAYRAYRDFPRSEAGKKEIERIAKIDFEKQYGRKYTDNDGAAEYWMDMFMNEPDVYYPALLEYNENFEKSRQALNNMLDMLRPIYEKASKEILGEYANKSVRGVYGKVAVDVLAKSMEHYFT